MFFFLIYPLECSSVGTVYGQETRQQQANSLDMKCFNIIPAGWPHELLLLQFYKPAPDKLLSQNLTDSGVDSAVVESEVYFSFVNGELSRA